MNHLIEILYLTPLLICILWFISILVTLLNKDNLFKVPLLLFFLNSMLALIMSNLYERQLHIHFLFLYVPAVFSALSMFPLYYIYIRKLTSPGEYYFLKWYKHLLVPFFAMLIALILVFAKTSTVERLDWIHNLVFEEPRDDLHYSLLNNMDSIFRKLFLVISVIYFYLTTKIIHEYKSIIKQFFSNYERVSLYWFNTFKYSYFLTIIAAFTYFSLSRFVTSQTVVLPVITHFLLAIFFWNIGYYGKQQNKIFYVEELPDTNNSKTTYEKIGLETKLLEQLDEKQAYREKDLTLSKLALLIGTNKSYLSRYINQELNTNFNDLINEKRVLYAKELLLNENRNLYDICEISGFNSMSSFYRAFKKFAGTTPNTYDKDSDSK